MGCWQNVARRRKKIKGRVRKPKFPYRSKASSDQDCCFVVVGMRKIYSHQAAKVIIIFEIIVSFWENLH